MKNPNRIDAYIELLRKEWKKHPDLRFGQLVDNLVVRRFQKVYHEGHAANLFNIEDEDFFDMLKEEKAREE